RTEAAAVADERVRERDEWVEHDRPPARRTPRRRQVEMSWVADDERVEAAGTACEQPGFCRREAQRASRAGGPALTQVVPHRDVLLCDFHPCRAQARDHLCVARIRTLVGAEITDFQDYLSRPTPNVGARTFEPFAALLGEHFVDEQLGAVALTGAFLVMARDHLADQPEREELHADHHEQHPQQQQGTVADRVPEDLEHSQVDEDRRPERTEDQAEPPEEMQGPVAVAADERDGQEIEEAAEVALDAIARAAVL